MSKQHDYDKPCPCGSGRTYENCCWITELMDEKSKERKRQSRRIIKIVEKQASSTGVDFQHYADKAIALVNREPQPVFMGLSADQADRLIYDGTAACKDIVELNRELPPDAFACAHIVQDALFFLGAMAEQEPLKATAKGNLPRDFARRMFEKIDRSDFKDFISFRSERDSHQVHTLRIVLSQCGWIKIRHGKFSLTQKGRAVLAEGMTARHFEHLLLMFTEKFNWEYQDYFGELWIIQAAWLISMYFLSRKAGEFIEDREFFRYFFRINPDMIHESRRRETAFDHVASCYSWRFLQKFCAEFGFVEIRQDKQKVRRERKTYIRTTRLFKDYFQWQVEGMQEELFEADAAEEMEGMDENLEDDLFDDEFIDDVLDNELDDGLEDDGGDVRGDDGGDVLDADDLQDLADPRLPLRELTESGFRGYPVATVMLYGPDDMRATKLAVGIMQKNEPMPTVLKRWLVEGDEDDIRDEHKIWIEALDVIKSQQVKTVVMTEGIFGCPHEEGIDYPEGESCPECPFWAEMDKKAGLGGDLGGEIVEVVFSRDEIELILGRTFAGGDLTDRLEALLEDQDEEGLAEDTCVVCYTPEELEDLIGFVAAEANHAKNKRLRDRLDELCDKLEGALDPSPPVVH